MAYNGVVAVAIQHRDEIIARMSNGESITEIAQSLGYASHSGIIERLSEDEEYKVALRSGVIGKLEKREKELEVAVDNVTVTRADRLLGHARWWAEKLDRERFGKDQDGPTLTNITFNVQLSTDQLPQFRSNVEHLIMDSEEKP